MKSAKRLFALFFLVTLCTRPCLPAFANDAGEEDLPPVTLVQATNLRADSREAARRQVPILLMFAQHGCSWCQYVEEDQLKPMLRNADYRAKVIIRQVMTDDLGTITDFNGNDTDANNLAMRYNASLTPTIVFVDHRGNVLAPSIVGVRSTDFYGGELDDALALSAQRLQQRLAALKMH